MENQDSVMLSTCFLSFYAFNYVLYARLRNGQIMGTPAVGGRAASTGFSLSNLKSFQSNPPGTSELWPFIKV